MNQPPKTENKENKSTYRNKMGLGVMDEQEQPEEQHEPTFFNSVGFSIRKKAQEATMDTQAQAAKAKSEAEKAAQEAAEMNGKSAMAGKEFEARRRSRALLSKAYSK